MPAASVSARGATICAASQELAMTVQELWLAYVGVGGNATLAALRTWMAGTADIPDRDYDYVVQGLNDRFIDRGQDHRVAYSGHHR